MAPKSLVERIGALKMRLYGDNTDVQLHGINTLASNTIMIVWSYQCFGLDTCLCFLAMHVVAPASPCHRKINPSSYVNSLPLSGDQGTGARTEVGKGQASLPEVINPKHTVQVA